MRTTCAALLVLGLAVAVVGCKKRTDPTDPGEKKDEGSPGTPPAGGTAGKRGTFTVGKSTTYVTGPVDSTGHIDYAAALHERLGKGVKPEDNANVAIWKALGPTLTAGKVPPGLFDKLGMQAPPAQGDYYISLQQYTQNGGPNTFKAAFEGQKKLRAKVWTVNDDATISGWLRANEKPMAAIAEAVKKPQYYNPILPQQGRYGSYGLQSSLLAGVVTCDEVVRAFLCRATLLVGHGNPAGAWQDLMAAHRLARLIGRGGTLAEALVSVKLDSIACTSDLVFLARAKLDPEAFKICLGDLFSLPPLPDIAEKIDVGERFAFLDAVMLADRNGVIHFEAVGKIMERWPPGYTDEALPGVDWNLAMESANKWYDRMVAALREPDRLVRSKKVNDVDTDLVALQKSINTGIPKDMSQPLAKRSAMIGDMTFSFLIPELRKHMDERDRAQQHFDSTVVAFACVWYSRFNKKYPAKLANLSPTYLKEVPKDLFNNKELVYKTSEFGFEILSVGQNGIDEGGQSSPLPGAGDDIVIRFPPPPVGP